MLHCALRGMESDLPASDRARPYRPTRRWARRSIRPASSSGWQREGFRTCLPVVTPLGNPLTFRAWAPGQPLVARTWGIREPADDAAEIEPDVLLIPLLAFDRRGVRLGYGGGYYDRTLETLRARKRVTAIGLGFAEQEVAQAPCGRHDQRLDWVLLPDGPLKTL